MKKRSVKNILMCIFTCLFATALFLLSACASKENPKDTSVRVTLMDSELFEMQEGSSRTVSVEPGCEAEFVIVVKEGYFVSDIDYPKSKIDEGVSGIWRLTLPSVTKSLRVRVTCMEDALAAYITFDANGGEYIRTDGPYRMRYNPQSHLRINTSIGTDEMTREGYTLVGWNTEADGSGTFYGLGSRCDVEEDANPYLYAQWVKWTSLGAFEFMNADGGQTIIGYSGSEDAICIPAEANGLPVRKISRGAFVGSNAKVVIFPTSLETVEPGAFENCAIQELYFYDNMTEIGDSSFVNCPDFSTVHINAKLSPSYSAYDRHSNYADKVDLLRKNREKKKIVLYGGCGVYFSIESPLIYEAFGGEYEVVNMGLNGWFPGPAQADVILNFLQPGDILVHVPEMSSVCQLFYNIDFAQKNILMETGYDDRYFMTLESDYDILSLIDIRECPGVFDSFARYNNTKKSSRTSSYSDNADFSDEYGDYSRPKPARGQNVTLSMEADIRPDYLTSEALERLNRFYARAGERGARVFAGYAAVNEHGVIEKYKGTGMDYEVLVEVYEQVFQSGIVNATVIGTLEDQLYPGAMFFDSDWHLSDEAAVDNTQRLIENLKKFI